jgi:hypothetical protein
MSVTSGSSIRPNGSASRNGSSPDRPVKFCTPKQAQAIRAIARKLGVDLAANLREEYGVEVPDELTLAQASEFIDSLRASSES